MKDAYYFPHFSNARHDRKIKRLRKDLGIEGYGIYFMILEVLRDQEDFSYPMSDIDLLSDEFSTSEQNVEVVILKYDLFKVDADQSFYSPKLIEYLKPYLDRSKRARDAAFKRWHGSTDANASANALPEQSDGNASKVNKNKRNESIAQQAERIYQAYPRKVGKEKAIKSIIKALQDIDSQELFKKVALFDESVEGQNRQFIPHPATWFNHKRWEDDPKEWSAWKQNKENKQEYVPGYLNKKLG